MQLIEQILEKESGVPASDEAIAEAEKELGFPLPKLLHDIYKNVSNGGIGPGYKILGVKGGHTSDEGDTISELYSILSSEDPEDPKWKWPKGLVPFHRFCIPPGNPTPPILHSRHFRRSTFRYL